VSFVLRQITRRTGGGDIVRTRTLTTAEPVIGRGADADIQLGDLGVGLRHAQLRRTKADHVEVEALGPTGFEVDGQEVTRAELTLAAAPVLTFGAYGLTLTTEGGDVIVTVARDEDAEEAVAGDERVFSLAATGFSKRRLAWTLALLILAVGLAWPIAGFFMDRNQTIRGDAQWSSGPLSQAHAFLEDDCQACHVKAFVAVRDDACMTCHEAGRDAAVLRKISAEVKANGSPDAPRLVLDHADHERLLHGAPLPGDFGGKVEGVFRRVFNRPDDRCGSCHVEHTAARKIPALVNVNDCAGCHAELKGRLKDTDLADVTDWGRHPDFRPLVTVSPAAPQLQRIALAQRPRENTGLVFPHRLHVSPTGGPARMATTLAKYGAPLDCGDCHRPDKGGRGFAPVQMERDCADCHSLGYVQVGNQFRRLPHGDPKKVEVALRAEFGDGAAGRIRAAFSEGGACVDCHTVTAGAGGYRIAPVHLADRFLPRGAFDHSVPEHRRTAKGQPACATCHAAATSESSADLLLAPIAKCADCHGKTEAQVHAPGGAECSECHSYHAPGTPARKPATGRR
jgi:hypothetical protein